MEYRDDMDADPVQWQSSQAIILKRIFEDAPPAAPAHIPTTTPNFPVGNSTRNLPRGRKRKERLDEVPVFTDVPINFNELGLGLQASILPNPARRNTRVSSASAVMLGRAVSTSAGIDADMPPPRLKTPKSDASSSSIDEVPPPLSSTSSRKRSIKGNGLGVIDAPHSNAASTPGSGRWSILGHSSSSRSSITTAVSRPCTPPARNTQHKLRPASVPTAPISALVSPKTDMDLPPSPPTASRPVLSVRTSATTSTVQVDNSFFSARSDSASTTASADTATTLLEPVSPITPVMAGASLPVIDLTFTPSPSPPPMPNPVRTAPLTRSATVRTPPAPPPQETPSEAPAPRPPTVISRSAPSQPQPPRVSVPVPTRAQTVPSQTTAPSTTRASQQWPRVFPASQTRLGMGAVGTGYASKPFKIPSLGKVNPPLTVSALPPRGRGVVNPSIGVKAKGKTSVKVSPAGQSIATLFAPASPTKRKENSVVGPAGKGKKETLGRKTPTPIGRPTASVSRSATSAKPTASFKHRGGSSSDGESSYLASDASFDNDALDAALEKWDNE